MTNENFLKCLANRLSIGPSKFIVYIQNWRKINFLEVRGLTEMWLEIKQKIYNVWVENSINSMDCRNGRNMINITKCKYLSWYQQLENKIVKVEERKKWGSTCYMANIVLLTCTVWDIKKIEWLWCNSFAMKGNGFKAFFHYIPYR